MLVLVDVYITIHYLHHLSWRAVGSYCLSVTGKQLHDYAETGVALLEPPPRQMEVEALAGPQGSTCTSP